MSYQDANRLQSLVLLACEGNKDLSNGREYIYQEPAPAAGGVSDVVPKVHQIAPRARFVLSHKITWRSDRGRVRRE